MVGLTTLYPARHIRTVFRIDGAAVLLDLKTRALTFLSPEAALVWEHLLGGLSLETACCAVTEEFEVDYETFCGDLEPQWAVMCELGLLGPERVQLPTAEMVAEPDDAPVVEMSQSIDRRSVAWKYLFLAAALHFPAQVAARLPWTILESTIRRVRAIFPVPADDELAGQFVAASRRVGRFAPQRSMCLESTLTAFLMGVVLRRPPTWCLGLRFGRGIEMHSWTEGRDGLPILEEPMRTVPFGAFMRV
jgi:hypothetical protein